ncbi:arsenate reductase (glutaredoxin) [bacterium]|nr:arsenate reductase (glutaredoxin) [bacterium]|tara:strand:+ start:964 stop:1320 length:357 start_codon:yes stop_codon:yes gene_type:complete
MNDLTIYHNPRCSKSRETLQIIKDNGIQPTVVEYLKKPLKKFELENISRLLNKRPKEFVRKSEVDFKENNIKNIIENDAELINRMTEFPKIIERPIVISRNKAVIGRPPENVLELLDM